MFVIRSPLSPVHERPFLQVKKSVRKDHKYFCVVRQSPSIILGETTSLERGSTVFAIVNGNITWQSMNFATSTSTTNQRIFGGHLALRGGCS